MGLFRRLVYGLWVSAAFFMFALVLNIINIHSIDGVLTNIGVIWLFLTVVEELYFVNL